MRGFVKNLGTEIKKVNKRIVFRNNGYLAGEKKAVILRRFLPDLNLGHWTMDELKMDNGQWTN